MASSDSVFYHACPCTESNIGFIVGSEHVERSYAGVRYSANFGGVLSEPGHTSLVDAGHQCQHMPVPGVGSRKLSGDTQSIMA